MDNEKSNICVSCSIASNESIEDDFQEREQAESSIIPKDWKIKEIGSFHPFVTSGSRGWARYYSETGAPFIRITNLSRNSIHIDFEDLRFVNLPIDAFAEASRTSIQDGDLLISITADIGIIGFVDSSVKKPAYINQHIALIRFDHDSVYSKFLAYYLASEKPQRLFIASMDVGAKAGMNLTTIKKLQVAVPILKEQRAIAEALSDVDELIGALDALIAKKRAIKQAAMQQLLTGKTRLPGFNGEWRIQKLGELGHFLKGRGVSRANSQSGPLACVRYGELYTIHNDYIRTFHSWISAEVAASATHLERGDILFAGSGETKEEIGKCAAFLDEVEAYAGGDIVILRPSAVDSLFLGYVLNTNSVNQQKASLGQGDAVVHISAKALAQVCIPLPKIEEQIAIAKVFYDMDAEIDALEQRRDKTKAIKQGMMQELLSGSTRLI